MIQRDTEEDKLRVKREVVHKEKSLLHLGTMKDCLGHIDYLPLDAVGSGNYGQCYRAHFTGPQQRCQEDDTQGYRRGQVKGEA